MVRDSYMLERFRITGYGGKRRANVPSSPFCLIFNSTLKSPAAICLVAFVIFLISLTRKMEATKMNRLPAINE